MIEWTVDGSPFTRDDLIKLAIKWGLPVHGNTMNPSLAAQFLRSQGYRVECRGDCIAKDKEDRK